VTVALPLYRGGWPRVPEPLRGGTFGFWLSSERPVVSAAASAARIARGGL